MNFLLLILSGIIAMGLMGCEQVPDDGLEVPVTPPGTSEFSANTGGVTVDALSEYSISTDTQVISSKEEVLETLKFMFTGNSPVIAEGPRALSISRGLEGQFELPEGLILDGLDDFLMAAFKGTVTLTGEYEESDINLGFLTVDSVKTKMETSLKVVHDLTVSDVTLDLDQDESADLKLPQIVFDIMSATEDIVTMDEEDLELTFKTGASMEGINIQPVGENQTDMSMPAVFAGADLKVTVNVIGISGSFNPADFSVEIAGNAQATLALTTRLGFVLSSGTYKGGKILISTYGILDSGEKPILELYDQVMTMLSNSDYISSPEIVFGSNFATQNIHIATYDNDNVLVWEGDVTAQELVELFSN